MNFDTFHYMHLSLKHILFYASSSNPKLQWSEKLFCGNIYA